MNIDKKIQQKKCISFNEINQVPNCSGVYIAIYNEEIIYVGKATGKKTGGLKNRLKSHYNGKRGSDQFCLYIYDSFIKEILDGKGRSISNSLNEKTAKWIQENITFRFFETSRESSKEKYLIKKFNPLLNSNNSKNILSL